MYYNDKPEVDIKDENNKETLNLNNKDLNIYKQLHQAADKKFKLKN